MLKKHGEIPTREALALLERIIQASTHIGPAGLKGLALLIYALAERQLCLNLEKNNEQIPDQKGKLTSTPTIRWVFQTFEGIDILSVWVNGQPTLRQVLNLRPVHQQIIRLFGSQVRNCYFLDS